MIHSARIALALCVTLLSATASASYNERSDVAEFLEELAERHQFDPVELRSLMRDVQTQKKVLQAIARPAEAKPWNEYRPIFLTESRIREGAEFWDENETLLGQIAGRTARC